MSFSERISEACQHEFYPPRAPRVTSADARAESPSLAQFLLAARASAESHPKRNPQPWHPVRVAGAVGQPLSLVNRECKIVPDEIEVCPGTKAVAKTVSKGKQRIDISAARGQFGTIGVALQIPVGYDSSIKLQHLMEADSCSGVKSCDKCHHVEMSIAARTLNSAGRPNPHTGRRIHERNVRPASGKAE